jgi:hypothetical protein
MKPRRSISIWLTLTEQKDQFHLVCLMRTRSEGKEISLLMDGIHNDLNVLFTAMMLQIQMQRESQLNNFFVISFDSIPTELQFLALREIRATGFNHHLFHVRIRSLPDPNHAQILADAQVESSAWRQLPLLPNFAFLNSMRLN